jgi:AbrB family looped-hinge helix DNA binding protein
MTKKTYTFTQEEIFQEISGDPENINMTIPPQVCEQMGWNEGDTLKINIEEDGVISIIKADDE